MLLIAKTLTELADHGGLQVRRSARPVRPPGAEQASHSAGPLLSALGSTGVGGQVRLTDLGRYAVQRQFLPRPAAAPAAVTAIP